MLVKGATVISCDPLFRLTRLLQCHNDHNDRNSISNHQRFDCLLKRLLRHRSKKTSKLCITGLCEGNSPVTGETPNKGPVRRKMFPFDDVIMHYRIHEILWIMNQYNRAWMNNYTHMGCNSFPNLGKLPLKSVHGWVITHNMLQWIAYLSIP